MAETQGVYVRLVRLEAMSTFGFQGEKRWLADVRPDILPDDLRGEIADAKVRAAARKAAEARLGKEILFQNGWPTRMLTDAEADLLAEVRTEISAIMRIPTVYVDRESIHGRYAQLIAEREEKDARKAVKAGRRKASPSDPSAGPEEEAAPAMAMA